MIFGSQSNFVNFLVAIVLFSCKLCVLLQVWDVLSNEEVVEIVSTAPTRSSAARLVVESAAREWKSKYPTSKMDDCAVVCLFLDGKMDSEPDYNEQSSILDRKSTRLNSSPW